MKGILFVVLTLLIGAVIGIGLEKGASFLPQQIDLALTRTYLIGVHPMAVRFSVCGALGLVMSYLIILKFVKK